MTLIKQEKLVVYIGYFIHSGVYMCFCKIVYGYPEIANFVYPIPKTTENAQLYSQIVRHISVLKDSVVTVRADFQQGMESVS